MLSSPKTLCIAASTNCWRKADLFNFLQQRWKTLSLAPGLTPRSLLDKMAALQMVDVHLPTTDGQTIILSRYTEPEADQAILLQPLKLRLASAAAAEDRDG